MPYIDRGYGSIVLYVAIVLRRKKNEIVFTYRLYGTVEE